MRHRILLSKALAKPATDQTLLLREKLEKKLEAERERHAATKGKLEESVGGPSCIFSQAKGYIY